MSESVTHSTSSTTDIAHLIRTETADGHTHRRVPVNVMTRRDKPFTPKKLRIRQTDRMAAAREILRRGFGHFGRKRKLVADDYDANYHDDTNAYDTLHSDLAKRMREYTEHGTDAVRFLLDVMQDTSLDPDEAYPGTTRCQQPTSYSAAAGTPTTTTSPRTCSKTTGATSSPPA